MANPYAKYLQPQGAPAGAAPQGSQYPGIIQGAPKPPEPYKPPAGYQGGPDNLTPIPGGPADPGAKPDKPPAGYRWSSNGTLVAIPGGPGAKAEATAGQPSESERTAGFLAGRLVDGVKRLTTTVKQDPDAASPSLGVETVRKVLGDTPANYLTDEQRQITRAAQIDIIDAALTLGTGAAYTKEQLEGYREAYFPALGDGPETIAAKREALRSLLVNAQTKAGRAAPDIEAALASLDDLNNPQAAASEQDGAAGGLEFTVSDETPSPYDPGGPLNPGTITKGTSPFMASVGDIAQGAGDLVGLIGNPINATINAATGTNLSTDLGETLRTDILGIPHGDPTMEVVNRFGTAALTGSGIARGLATIANPGTAQSVLNILGRTPIRDTVAGMGAGAGSVAGREIGGTPGEIGGALIGGMAGFGGANAITNALAPRQMGRVGAAAARQNIEMMPADAGGTAARMATGIAGRSLGEIPIVEGAKRSNTTAVAARDRVAGRLGEVTDEAGAGQAAQRGARGWMSDSADKVDQLYGKVSVPDDAQLQLTNTRQALEELTQGFKSNRQLSKIWTGNPRLRATLEAMTPKDVAADGRKAFMEASQTLTNAQLKYDQLRNATTSPAELAAVRQEIDQAKIAVQRAQREATREPVGGELSWGDAQRLRSVVGEIIGKPSMASDGAADAALRKFYASLTRDMEATAGATSPRALTEWRRATQYKRGRENRIETVLTSILGKKGDKGEAAAFEQINRWAQSRGGDFKKVAQALRSMDPEEANTVRATLLGRMGNAGKGAQNAEGDAFSPATFVTQWNGLDPRARSMMFPKAEHRAAIKDLVTVFDEMKQAGKYTNYSMTSLGTNAVAQTALAVSNPVLGAVAAMGQLAVGRLLASPTFARHLARAPRTENPRAAKAWAEQLGKIAAREPAVAADASQLQALLSGANDNAALVANAAADNEGGQE